MYYLFWHLRSEGRRLRGHAATGQDLTVLSEMRRGDRWGQTMCNKSANREIRLLLHVLARSGLSHAMICLSEKRHSKRSFTNHSPFKWNLLHLWIFHIINDLLLSSTTASTRHKERKANDEKQTKDTCKCSSFLSSFSAFTWSGMRILGWRGWAWAWVWAPRRAWRRRDTLRRSSRRSYSNPCWPWQTPACRDGRFAGKCRGRYDRYLNKWIHIEKRNKTTRKKRQEMRESNLQKGLLSAWLGIFCVWSWACEFWTSWMR